MIVASAVSAQRPNRVLKVGNRAGALEIYQKLTLLCHVGCMTDPFLFAFGRSEIGIAVLALMPIVPPRPRFVDGLSRGFGR